jgi:hypothetical protein
MRLPILWPPHAMLRFVLRANGLRGCKLGGLPRYMLVHLGLRCVSSMTTSSLGPPNARTSSFDQVSRLSITTWPMVWLKLVCFGSSSISSILRCQRALSSTVTTSAPSTFPPTLFSTSVRSMSRSTSISSGNALLSVMSASCTFRQPPSSWTSSRRVYPLWCFQIFGSVSTFVVVTVSYVPGVLENVL